MSYCLCVDCLGERVTSKSDPGKRLRRLMCMNSVAVFNIQRVVVEVSVDHMTACVLKRMLLPFNRICI